MRIPRRTADSRVARARAGRTAALASLLGASAIALATPSQAAATGRLIPATGGALAARTVIFSGTGLTGPTGTPLVLDPGGSTHGVSFAAGRCAHDAESGFAAGQIDAAGIEVVTATRMTVSVPGAPDTVGGLPATVVDGIEVKRQYSLCVYAATPTGSVHPLLTRATYTVYPEPTLAEDRPVAPPVGPAYGGRVITVHGDTRGDSSATASGYFSRTTTATLGGVRLANLKIARDGDSFTAVAPALPLGPADLIVATEGGSVTREAAYTSVISVEVSPGRVAPEGGTLLSVKGLGLLTPSEEPGFGVLLVTGRYDRFSNPGEPCTDVRVLSDTELTCLSPPLPIGSYTVVVTDTSDDAYAGAYVNILTSGATVTSAPF